MSKFTMELKNGQYVPKLTKRQQAHENLRQSLFSRVDLYDRHIIYRQVEPSLSIRYINNLISYIEDIPKDESLYLCFKRDYYGKVISWFLEKDKKHIRVRTYVLFNRI